MAEEKRLDETIPGGRYIVNGQTVDAFGQPVKETARTKASAPTTNDDEDVLSAWPELAAAGYRSPEDVQGASDEELLAVPGIGKATLVKIREATAQE